MDKPACFNRWEHRLWLEGHTPFEPISRCSSGSHLLLSLSSSFSLSSYQPSSKRTLNMTPRYISTKYCLGAPCHIRGLARLHKQILFVLAPPSNKSLVLLGVRIHKPFTRSSKHVHPAASHLHARLAQGEGKLLGQVQRGGLLHQALVQRAGSFVSLLPVGSLTLRAAVHHSRASAALPRKVRVRAAQTAAPSRGDHGLWDRTKRARE